MDSTNSKIENFTLPVRYEDGLRLDQGKAKELAAALCGQYVRAEPYPHLVADGFLPEPLFTNLVEKFPGETMRSDVNFESGYSGLHKRQIFPEDCSDELRRIFYFFNSGPFLRFLEQLTSIEGLVPDPFFSGGGLHETTQGGKLGVHADFRVKKSQNLQRRLNLLIYLNENWKEEYGGALEIWDKQSNTLARSILPVANRCVIFNTDADSLHGHPDPLTTPDGISRRSLAMYYYTASKRIYEELPGHSTMYYARPQDDAATHKEARRHRFYSYLQDWVPPAIYRRLFDR